MACTPLFDGHSLDANDNSYGCTDVHDILLCSDVHESRGHEVEVESSESVMC